MSREREPEGQTYERKGAFLWNHRTAARDPKLRLGCLKTIAAFLNTEGGLLEIGISDSGVVTGLDQELASLFAEDHLDQYQLLIEEAVSKTLFPLPLGQCKITFETRDGLWVCQVLVKPKAGVTYLREQNQAGDQVFSIYVRTGNRTVCLHDIHRDEFVVRRLNGATSVLTAARDLSPLNWT